MAYEIDQSNKIESSGDTVLALANDKSYTIRIPAREKQAAIATLRQYFDRLSRKLIYIRVFSAALYFLVREVPPGQVVTIDTGYSGHERQIKALLVYWLRRDRVGPAPDDISFGRIGKKSPAHEIALAVYRGNARPNAKLRADDLLNIIIGP